MGRNIVDVRSSGGSAPSGRALVAALVVLLHAGIACEVMNAHVATAVGTATVRRVMTLREIPNERPATMRAVPLAAPAPAPALVPEPPEAVPAAEPLRVAAVKPDETKINQPRPAAAQMQLGQQVLALQLTSFDGFDAPRVRDAVSRLLGVDATILPRGKAVFSFDENGQAFDCRIEAERDPASADDDACLVLRAIRFAPSPVSGPAVSTYYMAVTALIEILRNSAGRFVGLPLELMPVQTGTGPAVGGAADPA